MSKIITLIITVIMLIESVPLIGTPVLTVDAADRGDRVSTYATGFLYGLAEPGVPSDAMTESLDIASVSQKVIGGLQHPTGDVDRLSGQLSECDYRVVYLQDTFDTWYYCHKEIMEMRAAGTYDWRVFLEERYLPIVEEKVRELSAKDYADDIVYCIYNECDNAIWFGNYVDGNVHYDDIGRKNFYEAWKITYDLVKSIDPDAKIGGPGFCDYETGKITGFMEYASENSCVPEIMIYHELGYWSIPDWHLHVEDYRRIESELGISELPIIVTEYGTMEDCGNPAAMAHYIFAMERSNVYGNMAFWRLANNLNDTAADDNSPNSNWWLYRKYAEMEGQHLATSSKSQGEYNYMNRHDGIASITDDETKINIITNGSAKRKAVKLENLGDTDLGSTVDVTVECVYYSGLSGIVSEPITLRKYKTSLSFGSLNINIPATDSNSVYFITVEKHEGEIEAVRNTNIPVRYEFEKGKLLGDAYTYDSAYATTGEKEGMVGGMEKEGDGVRINVNVSEAGRYRLSIIYGKHNDSGIAKERDYGRVNFTLNGETQVLMLENTIKSEYTTLKTIEADLRWGINTIEFTNNDGTYVLDSIIVSKAEDDSKISVLEDSTDGTAYLAVAPYDGYFRIDMGDTECEITVDGAKGTAKTGSVLYLRRGLNEITFASAVEKPVITEGSPNSAIISAVAESLELGDGAEVFTDKYGNTYVGNINGNGGMATFTAYAPEAGDYRVTVLYSNNSEGGAHDYNVDLIERYLTVSVNGGEGEDIFFRNTYSDYTYKTVTFNITLAEGTNTVAFSNSGEYTFAGLDSVAPFVKSVTVNEAVS